MILCESNDVMPLKMNKLKYENRQRHSHWSWYARMLLNHLFVITRIHVAQEFQALFRAYRHVFSNINDDVQSKYVHTSEFNILQLYIFVIASIATNYATATQI